MISNNDFIICDKIKKYMVIIIYIILDLIYDYNFFRIVAIFCVVYNFGDILLVDNYQ